MGEYAQHPFKHPSGYETGFILAKIHEDLVRLNGKLQALVDILAMLDLQPVVDAVNDLQRRSD